MPGTSSAGERTGGGTLPPRGRRRTSTGRGGLLAPLLALCLAACAEPPPRHVILLLVDTLRADHLGAYGYSRPTSPNFDRLARSSILLEDARSQASCTFPSVNSLLTSRSPEAFLGQPGKALGIPAGIPSLAELLRDRGFRTVAVSASPIMRRTPSRFNPGGGFGRGFEVFDEQCLWRPAACVNDRALALFGDPTPPEDNRPLFLYLHYMGPHAPSRPPPGHRRRFAAAGPARDFVRRGDPNPVADFLYKGAPDPRLTPDELRHLVDLYDEEVAYFDAELGRLLGALERRGWLDSSLLVLASDHGEELLEHGHVKHCRTLFDTSVRVPLLLRAPGSEGRRLALRAQNLDLVPTVLDFLGIASQGLGFEGRNLRPAIAGEGEGNAWQFAVQGSLRSAGDGRFKLIGDLAAGKLALYDLAADPGETRDVLRTERRAFATLRQALRERLARADATGEGLRKAEEAEQRLRSLGYLE